MIYLVLICIALIGAFFLFGAQSFLEWQRRHRNLAFMYRPPAQWPVYVLCLRVVGGAWIVCGLVLLGLAIAENIG
jgi:hypothetical protein